MSEPSRKSFNDFRWQAIAKALGGLAVWRTPGSVQIQLSPQSHPTVRLLQINDLGGQFDVSAVEVHQLPQGNPMSLPYESAFGPPSEADLAAWIEALVQGDPGRIDFRQRRHPAPAGTLRGFQDFAWADLAQQLGGTATQLGPRAWEIFLKPGEGRPGRTLEVHDNGGEINLFSVDRVRLPVGQAMNLPYHGAGAVQPSETDLAVWITALMQGRPETINFNERLEP